MSKPFLQSLEACTLDGKIRIALQTNLRLNSLPFVVVLAIGEPIENFDHPKNSMRSNVSCIGLRRINVRGCPFLNNQKVITARPCSLVCLNVNVSALKDCSPRLRNILIFYGIALPSTTSIFNCCLFSTRAIPHCHSPTWRPRNQRDLSVDPIVHRAKNAARTQG